YPALQSESEAVLDLIRGEFDLRKKQGDSPQLDEYLRRFPQYATQLKEHIEGIEVSEALENKIRSEPDAWPPTITASPLKEPPIDGYQLQERIPGGGMGIVYKAKHRTLGKVVALKVMQPEFLADPGMVRRFEHEMQAVGSLNHENIVLLYHADCVGARHFF